MSNGSALSRETILVEALAFYANLASHVGTSIDKGDGRGPINQPSAVARDKGEKARAALATIRDPQRPGLLYVDGELRNPEGSKP